MAIEDSTTAPLASSEQSAASSSHWPLPSFDPHWITVSDMGPGIAYLRLRGRWLEDAGFPPGTLVRVEVSQRRLVVEAVEPEAALRCAEPGCPHEAKSKRRPRRGKASERASRATFKD
jgi:hypothetical protein